MPYERLFNIAPSLPLWLFVLRLAATLSNIMLLVFAVFLFFSAAFAAPLIVAYSLLLMLFCSVNMRAVRLSRTAADTAPALQNSKTLAHLLSAALPLAYVAGALNSGLADALELKKTLAIIAPPLLNWLAIEETLRFSQRQRS